jgi:hypothetical protein
MTHSCSRRMALPARCFRAGGTKSRYVDAPSDDVMHYGRSQGKVWAATLAILVLLTGCAETRHNPAHDVTFNVEPRMGCTLAVGIHEYAMHLSDEELGRLVKAGMETELRGEPASTSGLSCPNHSPIPIVWHVDGRPGRQPSTVVDVELFESDHEPVSAYSLICGPNDPYIKNAISDAVRTLTYRVLNQHPTPNSPLHADADGPGLTSIAAPEYSTARSKQRGQMSPEP